MNFRWQAWPDEGGMMPITRLIIIALLLFGSALLANDPWQDYLKRLKETNSEQEQLAILREAAPKLTDVNSLRMLQDIWRRSDPEGCKAFFKDQYLKNPKSAEYHYLYLRSDEGIATQKAQIELCKKHPRFYWGYRMLAANLFSEKLVEGTDKELLKREKKRFKYLEKGLKRFPEDGFLNMVQFFRYRLAGDLDKADKYLLRINDSSLLQQYFQPIQSYFVENNKYDAYGVLATKMVSSHLQAGEIEAADSLAIWNSYMVSAWEEGKQIDKLEVFFKSAPEFQIHPWFIRSYENLLRSKQAYSDLTQNLIQRYEKELISYPEMKDAYPELEDNKEFAQLLQKAAKEWENSLPARQEEALKNRLDKPAPLWELPDAEGTIHKLEDLKGMVLVLDFWATWCGPCRKAMPALDKWMKHEMSKGVQVFSINIFDKGNKDKAITFFKENGYHMQLLFAEDTLAQEYEFNSIPYICVIDKKGNLAYTQLGFSPDLEEKLSIWTQALLKE